ncbi:hypothetical protein L1987_63260 [Smallanthus sonchifolius]|uniref:Uncharacterized protein n=1 Tax=Smallanthus sonchifolius TaxID=185202 RepID=A0ACB9CD03_9ASTR|nr:hypothetical protein L1987_63260 [Smallanthus sonchifolius]
MFSSPTPTPIRCSVPIDDSVVDLESENVIEREVIEWDGPMGRKAEKEKRKSQGMQTEEIIQLKNRSQARIVEDASSRYCVYESDIATGMGVGALLFLLVSQLLVMIATRCLCCGQVLSPGRSRALAIFLFITCWVTFIIAEACLLAGSVRNAYHTKYRTVLSANPPSYEGVIPTRDTGIRMGAFN